MIRHARLAILVLSMAPAATPAQSLLDSLGQGKSQSGSGLSGLMGGLMPNVASTGAGNAAGVLSYCVKNKYLGGGDAMSALSGLTAKKGLTTGKGYAAGEQGQLATSNGTLSLDSMKGKIKSRVCDLVLQHAKSLL